MEKRLLKSVVLVVIFFTSIFTSYAQCVQCDTTSVALGNFSSAIGMNNSTSAASTSAFVGGYGSVADGALSFAFGQYVKATGTSAYALGKFVEAIYTGTMVIGSGSGFENKLINNVHSTLMIGFGSSRPTLFVGRAPGEGYTGKIGIGDVTEPQAKLHIKGDYLEQAEIFVEPHAFGGAYRASLWLGTKDYGIRARYSRLEFKVGHDGNYVFNDGNIGIGTVLPNARLHIADGDIYLQDISKGIIMKSPDGQCWRGTLTVEGNLIFNQTDCPGEFTTSFPSNSSGEESIRIYPNPVSRQLFVQSDENLTRLTVKIYSMDGKLIFFRIMNGNKFSMDMEGVPPGTCIVHVEGEGKLLKAQQIVVK
ncbi:MAG: T9SS type A sorting domain-containing protein [Bacteroidales bacterium]